MGGLRWVPPYIRHSYMLMKRAWHGTEMGQTVCKCETKAGGEREGGLHNINQMQIVHYTNMGQKSCWQQSSSCKFHVMTLFTACFGNVQASDTYTTIAAICCAVEAQSVCHKVANAARAICSNAEKCHCMCVCVLELKLELVCADVNSSWLRAFMHNM